VRSVEALQHHRSVGRPDGYDLEYYRFQSQDRRAEYASEEKERRDADDEKDELGLEDELLPPHATRPRVSSVPVTSRRLPSILESS
jgi:hypothetical protein